MSQLIYALIAMVSSEEKVFGKWNILTSIFVLLVIVLLVIGFLIYRWI